MQNRDVPIELEAVEQALGFVGIAGTIEDIWRHERAGTSAPFWGAEAGRLERVVLTPDFHRAGGIPVGTVAQARGFVVPQNDAHVDDGKLYSARSGGPLMEDTLRFPSAVKHDPAIDRWLPAQRDDLRPFVATWFTRMRERGSDVHELMHDGCPTSALRRIARRGTRPFARWLALAATAAGLITAPAAVEARAGAGAALGPGEFFYQFRDDVVLWSAAQSRWGSGPYQLEAVPDDRSDQIVVSRSVDVRRLPQVLAQWRGRALRLHAWDGSACTARVTGLRLVGVARLTPAQAVAWNALRDPTHGDPAIGDPGWQDQPTMAESAWNQGAHFLVATVDRQDTCAAQAWARDAELPPPARATDEPVTDALRALAIETFRALPAWQRLQRAYAQAPDRRGELDPSWDRRGQAQPHVQRFRLAAGSAERQLISVLAVHDSTDSTSDRRLWAIFELDGPVDRPALLLRAAATGRAVPPGVELQAVIDLHGDGRAALLYGARTDQGVMLETGGALVDQPLKRAPR